MKVRNFLRFGIVAFVNGLMFLATPISAVADECSDLSAEEFKQVSVLVEKSIPAVSFASTYTTSRDFYHLVEFSKDLSRTNVVKMKFKDIIYFHEHTACASASDPVNYTSVQQALCDQSKDRPFAQCSASSEAAKWWYRVCSLTQSQGFTVNYSEYFLCGGNVIADRNGGHPLIDNTPGAGYRYKVGKWKSTIGSNPLPILHPDFSVRPAVACDKEKSGCGDLAEAAIYPIQSTPANWQFEFDHPKGPEIGFGSNGHVGFTRLLSSAKSTAPSKLTPTPVATTPTRITPSPVKTSSVNSQ